MFEDYPIRVCQKEENDYPVLLKEITGSPSLIYYRGNIGILNQYKNVAVIGSRDVSLNGLRLAHQTGQIVAKAGCNLINGLALGCDTEAVRGALSTGNRCVAILPCGLDQIQPKTNEKLAMAILQQGGCLISEYTVGTSLQKYHYVERDRLQSGLSQGVIVIETHPNSGTMHTVNFAERQGRRLACYAAELLGQAEGNQILENKWKIQVLRNNNDLQSFVDYVIKEETFEQLKLEF